LTDADLLAERRARRVSEGGDSALIRRAEAAEATVQTLERHVASLQQRLRDAEHERERLAELIEGERSATLERESELRRVKQREYAEQQLRVEAEERLLGSEREGRAEIERLETRLGARERDAHDLASRIERLERQLAEAEQAAVSEKAALTRAETDLQRRLEALEQRARAIEQGLGAERAAREQAEAQLRALREGNARIQGLVRDLRGVVARLGAGIAAAKQEQPAPAPVSSPARSSISPPSSPPQAPESPRARPRDTELAEALAAAVERLRARAQAVPEEPEPLVDADDEPEAAAQPADEATLPPVAMAAGEGHVGVQPAQSQPRKPPHKHSMSLIGRIRRWRKERHER
jgi:hypothetical protein